MPYKIRKVTNPDCYKVINSDTGKIYAKCTSLEKAKKQMRLLYMIENVTKKGTIF